MKSSYAKIVLILLLGIIASVVLFYQSTAEKDLGLSSQEQSQDSHQPLAGNDHASDHDHSHSNVAHPDVESNAPRPVALSDEEREKFIETSLGAVSKEERAALLDLTSVMNTFTVDEAPGGMTNLIDSLKQKKLSPYIMKDENPYTGSMSIVRTKSTLPGTRYFHAQLFKDEQGNDFVQHVSFEFKPGPNAFNAAKAALMKQFKITSAPTIDKEGFTSWAVGPYSVWVKAQTLEDFKNDAFNAHDSSDVGAVRAAAELEIHDHEAPIQHIPADQVAP